MAQVKRYTYKDNEGQGSTTAAYDRNGDRRGFVSKDKSSIGYTRYGVGIDEMGPYDRGYYEGNRNMPIGDLDYGYDGDTVYAGFTPNVYRGENEYANWGGVGTIGGNRVGYYRNADGKSDYFAKMNDMYARAGRRVNDNGDNTYYGILSLLNSANAPEGSFRTPVGDVNYGPVEDAPGMFANFTPQNYYLQALANLLRGR